MKTIYTWFGGYSLHNTNKPINWYYVSVKPFKKVFYYLTEREIKEHEAKKID